MPEHPIRRQRILELLGDTARSATELGTVLGVTRQAVHFHLRVLDLEGRVRLIGRGRTAKWERVFSWSFDWPLDPPPAEDMLWREARDSLERDREVNTPTRRCLDYGVTEMLNNAIEHSGGTHVRLSGRLDGEVLEIVIADDGVGALQHVRSHFDLPSELDAIAHIAKGQQTTAPERHSGQGLFFTSKLFDTFMLDSGRHAWKVDNVRDDATIAPGSGLGGTRVILRTHCDSTRVPKDAFDKYSDPDTYELDRTKLHVRLADHGTAFMSRSEAKRLAEGLELYGQVELDFAGVEEVGQGFVDELFRVWPAQHPGTEIDPTNMSPEVEFMIRRGLPRRGSS